MDLYISPMTCSLTAHIACLEAGITPTLHRVDRKTKQLDDGRDYLAIAPKGNVPAIAVGDGVLTESAAVLQYIADQVPAAGLVPAAGTIERYRVIEWLNFVTSELHKKHLAMVFSTKTTAEIKTWSRELAPATLGFVESVLATHDYLVGARFTIADMYMFWALLVAPAGGIKLDAYPGITAYVARIRERPSVKTALAHDVPLYQAEVAAGKR